MTTRRLVVWLAGILAMCLMLYTCALPGDLPAGQTEAGQLGGTYTVNGLDPLGVEYSGTVVIASTGRTDEFDVEWIVTGGIQRGIGHRYGSTFEVDWSTVASGGGAGGGTALYRIEPDGRLIGTRTVEGATTPGTEEIFPEA